MDEGELKFGESEFRGPPSLYLDMKRWAVQFCALLMKNTLILWRRKLSVGSFLLLPSFVVLVFLMEQKGSDSSSVSNNRPAIPIEGLGECNVYYDTRCVRAVYSPLEYRTNLLMETLSAANGLEMGKDVLGFNSTEAAQSYVANNLGTVQYTIFFSNVSLWETSYMSPTNEAIPSNMSYVIFYNDTQDDDDPRSNAYNLNFPLLVLQKEIETSYFKAFEAKFEGYDANYGQFWQQEAAFLNGTFGNGTTPCDWSRRPDLANLGTVMPWVIVFSFLFMATITFNLIADEKRNKLFGFLRRLGLMDSAYWLSWFLVFQVMLLVACAIAMIVAAIVRTQSSALRAVDLNLLFLVLWLSGTSFISFSCFLAALSNSASMTTSLYSGQFLIALVTVAACSNAYDYYEAVGYDDGTVDASVCYLVSSSYNRIYSSGLMGYTFVQFLVFFLPWFHAAQAMSDVISVVQYEGQSISLSDIHHKVTLSYTADPDVEFDAPWIIQPFVMLICTTIVYMFLSWLAAQMLTADGTEGRGLHTILIPTAVRRLLFREREVVQDGDVRGAERQQSAAEGSVRAYKVSKTYSGVQALREVSFTMNKGEVFVLLGHNGAGKSTLINIITGMVSPTHGKVYMQGLDVEADSAQMQQIIGVCPQDDILWDDLTAREHMLLVAAFKGLRWGPVLTRAVDQILQQVQLLDRSSDFARMYSGGMKRRLSVALSTVGDVQIIVFDEPTTGLDPLSRRRVWETINSLKKNRVVVLTTHNMEEADFLGDNIMIMHGGRVRAIGDSLFLKQTYGNGYQVGMLVGVEHVEEVKTFVRSVLPGSACSADPVTGVVAVGVVKEDLGGLSRLFQWLEHSRRAKTAVREWGISNTTLEQVFLMLCVQNTEVNYVDPGRQTTQNQHALCPMCRTRFRSAVIVRVWPPAPAVDGVEADTQNSPLIALADSVCTECARGNRHYYIPEDQARDMAGNPAALSAFIENAHVQAELAKTEAMLSALETELPLEEEEASPAAESDALLPQMVAPQQIQLKPPTVASTTAMHQGSIQGTATAQVQALFVKNVTMQSKQRCANGCSVCFVGFMFLMLYIFSILLGGLSNSQQCDSGYLSSEGCDFDVLVHQIFSGTDEQLAFDEADTGLYLGPDGYAIRNYLVPVEMYNNYYITINNKIYVDDYAPEYGFSGYNARSNILWSSLIQTTQLTYMQDFAFNSLRMPTANGANLTERGPNDVQFASQELSLEQLLESPTTDTCPYYNPYGILGSYTTDQFAVTQEFAEIYSDAAFACPTCEAVPQGQRPNRVFFNGTVWVPRNKEASEWWCSDISCYAYPYAFFDYESNYMNSSYYYLPGGKDCPPGLQYISKSANQEQDQTLLSMTFSNLLTNSMLDPWLRTYSIQGGYSHYGVLYFDAQSVSEAQAFWMVLFGMMLMNGFWPMAVWRAAHERAFGLVEMMNTVGLRPWTYLLGMFLFDMVISLVAGIALLVFAVGVGLLNFKDAPIDLLVAIVVLSSYAFNACTLLLSMLAGSKASVLSLLAACLTIAFAAISALLNNLIFPNEGDWPMALSILPFLAQGRALYIVLVYHASTAEVTGSLLLMFGVGSIVLIAAFLIDEHGSIGPAIAKFTGQSVAPVEIDAEDVAPALVNTKEVAPAAQVDPDPATRGVSVDHDQSIYAARNPVGVVPQTQIRRELDEDLHREKMRAALYVRAKTASERAALLGGNPVIGDVEAEESLTAEEQQRLAIVLHKMKFQFPAGGTMKQLSNMFTQKREDTASAVYAVNGLSLALSLGECFGLLGPNGAGKSTTISVLIGRLRATLGAQYIAGENVINGLSKVHRFIGVCPQFDVVWADLTVAEHLSFQARQRGIPANLLNAKVQQAAVAVGLDGDGFFTKAGQLSGGMRRRLSIAMSLVGDPPIIFMDEPTTGLDPDNRQHIWHIIQKIKSPSRLILLTTHSMEEAEALCTRIGIMAKGQLRCVGSAQHLKAKYGKGYTLTVNSLPAASAGEMEERQRVLDAFILEDVGNGHASILSAINRTKKYLIDKAAAPSIAEIFKSMEAHKARLFIREWGLSMTTLEEVFISAVEEIVE